MPRHSLNPPLPCTRARITRVHFAGVYRNLSGTLHACMCARARMVRHVRACTRGCVGACNAREMRRTTIQILLLLLREQSPVNRPPRHNVSIQVRSAVLNRSGSALRESRKSSAGPSVDFAMSIVKVYVESFALQIAASTRLNGSVNGTRHVYARLGTQQPAKIVK